MTEFWVSQKRKWCEYCKCWLNDTAQAWAVHERGLGHKSNVQRKLATMRQQADNEKRLEDSTAAALGTIEAHARREFARDQLAETEHRRVTLGEWVWSDGPGYYYNAAQRYYYDPKSKMYYGGEPTVWTDAPAIPHDARYEVMYAPPSKAAAGAAAAGVGALTPAALAAAAAAGAGGAAAARPAAAGGARQYAVAGSRVMTNKHPLADVGGYQLHHVQGSVGGAKGVGFTSEAAKRKRDAGAAAAGGGKGNGAAGGKEQSAEEQEAHARREAARARVAARTATNFGLA